MDKKMFCFQCEQTVGCTGCTGNAGACGKKADTARLQDELTGALISLARAVDGSTAISKRTGQIIIEGLFTTVTNVNFDDTSIENMIQKVRAEKERLVPDCSKCQSPCGKTDEYDMQQLWDTNEDIRSLKSLILFGIRGMAAYAYHANVLNYEDAEVNRFFCEALFMIGYGESVETLLPTVLKVGEINLKCMALLDKANTETYGIPEPTDVTLTIEKGPFIVVTGHDLRDLQLLLEQTEGKGINIYTHGEMLPAHAYPLLKKFSHLKGNFGTAWQNQQKEFDHLPAPILYTTNCLMPPKSSYADRVFTTEVVAFPGAVHIDEKKDFTPVIEKAMELRNETPMVNNCAQTIMRVYADELGIDENLCAAIGCNFGGGMKCGGTCGAITAGLMVLGAKGVDSPMAVQQFRKGIAEKHDGMTDCADLLRANAQKGGDKKTHCDKMIQEAIELVDKLLDEKQ